MVEDDAEALKRIKDGDTVIMKELYVKFREPFETYIKRFLPDGTMVKDVYQEAMIALYSSVCRNKFDPSKASIKTYLYTIGKYKAIDINTKKDKEMSAVTSHYEDDYPEPSLTLEQKILKEKFALLGKKCREVIRLFYYRGLSLKDIVAMGNYKDENTVKSHKSRCMRQLRSLVKTGHHGK